jgi:hypothetical protein
VRRFCASWRQVRAVLSGLSGKRGGGQKRRNPPGEAGFGSIWPTGRQDSNLQPPVLRLSLTEHPLGFGDAVGHVENIEHVNAKAWNTGQARGASSDGDSLEMRLPR